MARRRRWRDYRTPGGRRPVAEFIDGLSDEDAAAVVAAMKAERRLADWRRRGRTSRT